MDLNEHLIRLAKRYTSKLGKTIAAYETERWPIGRLDELAEMGYLKPLPDARAIRCPACSILCSGVEPIKEIANDGTESYMVLCEKEGCLDIDPFYLKQWKITEKIKDLPKKPKKRTRRASSELSKRETQVYTMIHTRGITQTQAAIEFGCTVQNIWKHLQKAEKKLKAKAATKSINQNQTRKLPEDKRGQINVSDGDGDIDEE
jgi:DNA-binding CsgD family transcriptional regulator